MAAARNRNDTVALSDPGGAIARGNAVGQGIAAPIKPV